LLGGFGTLGTEAAACLFLSECFFIRKEFGNKDFLWLLGQALVVVTKQSTY
jgi:hypothetical protein